MKKLYLSLLLLNTLASAFTFDIWESKINLDEAIKIAKLNNIPLHKESICTINKNFNEKFLFLEEYPANRLFKYQTTLLSKRATVYLYFTKEEKKLYNLKVRWINKDKKLIDSIYSLLDKKYGERKSLFSNSFGEFIFSKKREWQDENNTIQVKDSLSGIEILYIDTIETKKEKEFKEKVKLKKEQKAIIEDAKKF